MRLSACACSRKIRKRCAPLQTDRQHLSELLENNNLIVEEFHGTLDPWEWCRASWIGASRATSPTAGRARCGHCRRLCAQYTPQFAGDRLRPSADAGGRGKSPPSFPNFPAFSNSLLTSRPRRGILSEMHRKGAINVTAATKNKWIPGDAFSPCGTGVSRGSGVFTPVAVTCFFYSDSRLR